MKHSKKFQYAYYHAYISPSNWHRPLKFVQIIVNNLSWHHVKFHLNARCLSSPYLTSNLPKSSKSFVFWSLFVNTFKNNGPRLLNCGGHLGDMIPSLSVKFGGNRRSLSGSYFTLNMKTYFKITIFKKILGNIFKMHGSRNLKFGELLGNMLQNGHVKFGVNQSFLTFYVPKKRPKMPIFGHINLKIQTSWQRRHFKFQSH